jgi:exodeoxyribonuclease VIII
MKTELIFDLSFDEYRAILAVNNSLLNQAFRSGCVLSMAHLRVAMLKTQESDSDALRFGRLAHNGVLDPQNIPEHYSVMPDLTEGIMRADGSDYSNVRATKEYKQRAREWCRQQGGREIITQDDYDRIVGVLRGLLANESARDMLTGDGANEVSMVWQDAKTGLNCKARVDRLCEHAGFVADLKTTRDVADFEKSIVRFGYHRQAAFYLDGLEAMTGERCRFGIVAVEPESPFACRAAFLSTEAIEFGRQEYRRALTAYARCIESGVWPSLPNPDEWRLPMWAKPQDDEPVKLIVNGRGFAA